ncbi:MAG: hypothetical protein AB7R55_22255, partial [Gemmatimonadales bacterium]
ILLAQTGLGVLQSQPIDFKLAEEVGRKATSLIGAGSGRTVQLANYVLGIGLIGQIADKYQAVVDGKTCEAVDALDQHVQETTLALKLGRDMQASFIDQQLESLGSYGKTIADMRKAYCK